MESFESRLRVRELLRGRPSACELAEALACVEGSPEQFEHPFELAERLRALTDPAQAGAVAALLPPVSRGERAALERRRAEQWGTADGAWGLGGE